MVLIFHTYMYIEIEIFRERYILRVHCGEYNEYYVQRFEDVVGKRALTFFKATREGLRCFFVIFRIDFSPALRTFFHREKEISYKSMQCYTSVILDFQLHIFLCLMIFTKIEM